MQGSCRGSWGCPWRRQFLLVASEGEDRACAAFDLAIQRHYRIHGGTAARRGVRRGRRRRRWGPLFAGELWGALRVFLAPGMIQTVLKKAATL